LIILGTANGISRPKHFVNRVRERKECPMQNRSRVWLWIAAAISFIMGLILVLNDNSGAGLFFVLMGITYLGASTRSSQVWADSNPSLGRWGLIGGTLLLVLLVIVVGVVLLLK
jgi:hypothetical protein